MRRLSLPLLCLLLSACGMKGPLYEPAPAATEATEAAQGQTAEPAADNPDKDERKMIPPTPDPAQSQ